MDQDPNKLGQTGFETLKLRTRGDQWVVHRILAKDGNKPQTNQLQTNETSNILQSVLYNNMESVVYSANDKNSND